MRFKAKVFKLGNSQAIYLPKNVYTLFKVGDLIELEVYTSNPEKQEKPKNVITKPVRKKFNTAWCPKHKVFKGTCGCK